MLRNIFPFVLFSCCLGFAACGESSGPKPVLELSDGDVELTYPGAKVMLSASIADADGPLEGVILKVTSERGDSDQIDPEIQQSVADGTATFEVTTITGGSAVFTLQAVDMDIAAVTLSVDFEGPEISGTWSYPQPDGVVGAPRIGLVWIDFGYQPGADVVYRELVSQALDPVPTKGDQGSFSVRLPLQAARGDLSRPDPTDPDIPETFMIAPYLPCIYDDLDASGDFNEGDALLALPVDNIMLVYAEGELPDPQYLPDAALGYQFMELVAGNEVPRIIPFGEQADKNDLAIRSAPCPRGTLAGSVAFGSSLPAGSDTRVAAVMVDADLVFNSGWDTLYNHGNFFELVSAAVAFSPDSNVAYQLALPRPGDVFPGYAGFLTDVMPELPAFGIIIPLVYIDADSDGAFTNPDDDLHTGDLIAGAADMPFGYDMPIIEWVDGIPLYLFSMMMPGVNQGYNLIHQPLKLGVDAVIDDNTLQVDKDVEPSHTGLKFKISRKVGSDDVIVITGDDLATGSAPGKTISSAAGGFSGVVQAGDEVVIQNRIDDGQVLDLDTAYDLKTP